MARPRPTPRQPPFPPPPATASRPPAPPTPASVTDSRYNARGDERMRGGWSGRPTRMPDNDHNINRAAFETIIAAAKRGEADVYLREAAISAANHLAIMAIALRAAELSQQFAVRIPQITARIPRVAARAPLVERRLQLAAAPSWRELRPRAKLAEAEEARDRRGQAQLRREALLQERHRQAAEAMRRARLASSLVDARAEGDAPPALCLACGDALTPQGVLVSLSEKGNPAAPPTPGGDAAWRAFGTTRFDDKAEPVGDAKKFRIKASWERDVRVPGSRPLDNFMGEGARVHELSSAGQRRQMNVSENFPNDKGCVISPDSSGVCSFALGSRAGPARGLQALAKRRPTV
ncbi:unnamed protein product [Prorocentrum cordatum]|uniref:Uncharacterized protein n=1 Tax=Prorocentrum cordatum TaxID=2364126 RepID=A0ABN9UZW9_9DINO|nr:unnamed protein product [Polarella glacialis]